jgi:bifunctional non-homologous end joining protein LigD
MTKIKPPVCSRCFPPMLADVKKKALENKNKRYLLQEKYDGTRGILHIIHGQAKGLISRYCENNFLKRFPEIAKDAEYIRSKNCILDGEITFFDQYNHPFFLTAAATPAVKKNYMVKYMVFDILEYEGKKVTQYPLVKRLELLRKIIPVNLKHIKVIKTYTNPKQYPKIYKTIVDRKGEGVMLKQKTSKYVPGSRNHWVKVKKVQTEDCVVCGITHGLGQRKNMFGALILGQYNEGKLVYVGNVGAGLSLDVIKAFYNTFMNMKDAGNPFDQPVGHVLKWVKPHYVVEVKCLERTDDGKLRLPVFMRVRADKLAKDCVFKW